MHLSLRPPAAATAAAATAAAAAYTLTHTHTHTHTSVPRRHVRIRHRGGGAIERGQLPRDEGTESPSCPLDAVRWPCRRVSAGPGVGADAGDESMINECDASDIQRMRVLRTPKCRRGVRVAVPHPLYPDARMLVFASAFDCCDANHRHR